MTGASFEINGDSSTSVYGDSGKRTVNQETLTKSDAGITTIDGAAFETSGKFIVSETTLRINSGGSASGNMQFSGGDFKVRGNTLVVDGLTSTETGVIRQLNGTVDIISDSQVSNFEQTGDKLQGNKITPPVSAAS